jgi:hypothetical protein
MRIDASCGRSHIKVSSAWGLRDEVIPTITSHASGELNFSLIKL